MGKLIVTLSRISGEVRHSPTLMMTPARIVAIDLLT